MKNVYLNHDGGVDDLISLYLLLKMENVRLIGCSVIPRLLFGACTVSKPKNQ